MTNKNEVYDIDVDSNHLLLRPWSLLLLELCEVGVFKQTPGTIEQLLNLCTCRLTVTCRYLGAIRQRVHSYFEGT